MSPLDYVNPKLIIESSKLEPGAVVWRSPSNLAVVKYWGKHGRQLPRNPSVSLTLETAFTETRLSYQAKETGDQDIALEFLFHGEPNPVFAEKLKRFLESIADIFPFLRQMNLKIESGNSFPHSSGIASSASSMSALALCLCSLEDELFDTLSDDGEFDRKASFVARLGSGSACRSIYPTMSLWGQLGEVEGSSDLYAIPFAEQVHEVFHHLHDDILIVSREEKSVSSRAGHSLMDQNTYADPRYQQARRRMQDLLLALRQGDLEAFGRIAENEALTLHALMMTSNPSYLLMRPNTLAILELIRDYRKETGHPVFFSLDAGPNVHLLYPEEIIHEVRLFVEEQLVPLCEDEFWLQDWAGQGPVQID